MVDWTEYNARTDTIIQFVIDSDGVEHIEIESNDLIFLKPQAD